MEEQSNQRGDQLLDPQEGEQIWPPPRHISDKVMDKDLYIQAPVVKKKVAAGPKEPVPIKIPKSTAPIQRLPEEAQYKIKDAL